MPHRFSLCFLLACLSLNAPFAAAQDGDAMIAEYFRRQTQQLQNAGLADVRSLEDWKQRRSEHRRQLFEMLGLAPLPSKTDLKPQVTGRTKHEAFTVERLHFQSRPGLYVTGNLYVPKKREKPLPAILYVCGHGRVKKDGISYGNKVHYHHHGSWFARNGYVCLTIDTLQLGEIEGLHHGTYNHNMWWWLNRGYTPAGVEAWNCIRALDYLQTRPEVDPERLGVTGRSGGGAYSWWIAALDERIKAAVPVAGITDLENHVIDGCVEGHCDCMYMVNTYQWDYAAVAALMAPRPLLISNTDRDRIFPLNGVVRLHSQVRDIYRLYQAEENLGLHITSGPHKDTQELRIHAFRWFNQHLKKEDALIDKPAEKYFEPPELQVFAGGKTPDDQKNTEIHESFVPLAAEPSVPENAQQWETLRDGWLKALREKSFRGWPQQTEPLAIEPAFSIERKGVRLSAWDFTSQGPIQLRLFVAHRAGLENPDLTVLNVLDEEGWKEFLQTMQPAFGEELKDYGETPANAKAFEQVQGMFKGFKWAMAYVAPRGVGPTAWDDNPRKHTQIQRRFYLLGQTLDGMRVWDARRAIQALRSQDAFKNSPLWLQSQGSTAGVALYASLYEPNIKRLDLHEMPISHRQGPFFLNVRRYFDLPQAVAMAAERSQVAIYHPKTEDWRYPRQVAEQLKWSKKQLQIRPPLNGKDE